ncbi:MAG TPA: hypothetical protein VMC82_01705 [Thermoplasmata archaeon]|nr:hypothetical protein [Thermoplasmata archaeon]
MPGSSYDRFGLTSNPFRDLASESLEDVEIYHVNLDIDRTLDTIREEIYAKENRALIALVGLHGAGKTERLLMAQEEARDRGAFSVYFDITTKTTWVTRGLAASFRKSANLGGFAQIFSAPRWYRDIAALERMKDRNYDPLKAGRALAEALNAHAPAFLLLNDLHNLAASDELGIFAKVLQEMVDKIKPGVLVMFGCFPSFMLQLATHQAPLSSRINRTLILPRLTPEEASLLLAKKLLAKRLVEGLDPLYPFDQESVSRLNQYAYGNPRRLLELADVCIEFAVAHRSYRIDTEIVRSALLERQVQDLKSEVEARSDGWKEDPPAGGIEPLPNDTVYIEGRAPAGATIPTAITPTAQRSSDRTTSGGPGPAPP